MGHKPPTFTNGWARGHREQNSKEETDQTVLTITKALTKTTKCTCRAKKWSGKTKQFLHAGRVPPLSATGPSAAFPKDTFRRKDYHCFWFYSVSNSI